MCLKKLNSYNGNHACRTGYIKKKTTDFSLRLQRDCVATATHKQNIMKIFA